MSRMDAEQCYYQTITILSKMISFLNLKSLWGYGFPAISRYARYLRYYLEFQIEFTHYTVGNKTQKFPRIWIPLDLIFPS